MKTNVKLPAFITQFLNIYTFATLVIGFFVIALVNIPKVIDTEAEAQYYGTCNCDYAANLGCGICNYSVTADFNSYCQGLTNSTGQTHIAMCRTPNSITCEALTSGHVCMQYYTSGTWAGTYAYQHCGNPLFTPQSTTTTSNPTTNQTTNPTTSTTSVPQGCPYGSTQARVQPNINIDWTRTLTINAGESFRIGSFHNATGQFASDTRIEVSGPNGFSYNCNTSNSGCNGHTISGVIAGTYTVIVKTFTGSGSFFSESECNARAIVNVLAQQGQCDIVVTKQVQNNDHDYEIGDTVLFDITIQNTGETVLEQVYFEDTYDPAYLQFVGIREQGSTAYLAVQHTDGRIVIQDLTVPLGDLGIGNSYHLVAQFTARYVSTDTQTWNYVTAVEDICRDNSGDYIWIHSRYVPPTW